MRVLRRAAVLAAEDQQIAVRGDRARQVCVVEIARIVAERKAVEHEIRASRIPKLHPVARFAAAAREQRVAGRYLVDLHAGDRLERLNDRFRQLVRDRGAVFGVRRRFGAVAERAVGSSCIGNVLIQRRNRDLLHCLQVRIDQHKRFARRLQRKAEADRRGAVPRKRVGLVELGRKQHEIPVRRDRDVRQRARLFTVLDIVRDAPAEQVQGSVGRVVQLDPVWRTVGLVRIAFAVRGDDFVDDERRGPRVLLIPIACKESGRHADQKRRRRDFPEYPFQFQSSSDSSCTRMRRIFDASAAVISPSPSTSAAARIEAFI